MSEQDEDLENQTEVNDSETSDNPEPNVLPPDLDIALESYDSDEALKNLGIKKNI